MSYVQPGSTLPLPGGLSLNQFLQTVISGISGIDGTLVRPYWQIQPPKQPDVTVDWVAFYIANTVPDANPYIDLDENGANVFARHETIEIGLSIYGPNAMDTYGLFRDGFQIPQNLDALRTANMGFVEVTTGLHAPDLFGGRWIDRVTTTILIRRQIRRTYAILSLVSASGTIQTEHYSLDWNTQT